MSNYQKLRLNRSKFLERVVRGIPWKLGGYDLDCEELAKLRDAWNGAMTITLITWDSMLLDVGCRLEKGILKRWRNAICEDPDILKMIVSLKASDEVLLHYCEEGTLLKSSYNRFKHDLREMGHKVSYVSVLRPLIQAAFVEVTWTVWFADIRTALLLLSRFNPWLYLTRKAPTPLLERKAELADEQMRSYVEHDVSLTRNVPAWTFHITRYFFDVLHELEYTRGPEPEDYRFSEGATTKTHRGDWFVYKDLLAKCSDAYCDETRVASIRAVAFGGVGDLPVGMEPVLPIGNAVCIPVAVPKNAEKDRIITFEPPLLQWFQQGVGSWLLRCVSNSPKTRQHIDFDRADLNAELAHQGSVFSDFVTIDLSSASDSVALWHIDMATLALPKVSYFLHLARCTHAEVGLERIDLKKYAGMGNRVTFILETLFFCAICEAAIRQHGDDPSKSAYRCYGDDIVIESKYADTVISILTELGFKVNVQKTFSGQTYPAFRESCGGHYLGGYDVTPIILPRSGYRPMMVDGTGYPIGDWPSQSVALANEFFEHHRQTRNWIVAHLIALPQRLRPLFSDDGAVGVKSTNPTNFHLQRRSSNSLKRKNDYQCEDIVYGGVHTKYDSVMSKETFEKSNPVIQEIIWNEYLRRLAIRQGRLDFDPRGRGPELPLDEGELITLDQLLRWSPRPLWRATRKPESWCP
jgi:hypothetical protein